MQVANREWPTPVLTQMLQHGDSRTRLRAAQGLRATGAGAKPAVAALRQALDDDDHHGRGTAALALAAASDDAGVVVPALTELLKHSEWTAPAAVALGRFGAQAEAALPHLGTVLCDPRLPGRTRIDVAFTVWRISGVARRAVPALATVLGDADPNVCILAASKIGEIGRPARRDASRALDDLQMDRDERVRKAARQALKKIEAR